MANVLIAGCGYVGTALGLRLVDNGHRVFALRANTKGLPDRFTPLEGRMSSPDDLHRFPYTYDFVVCTIGASAHSEDAYRAAYVDAIRALVDGVTSQSPPPKRILFTSSTAVYAQDDGSWVDEESPAEASHFAGRLVREGERIVLDSGIGIVLRLGGIYGPGRTRLIESVRDGSAQVSSGPPRYLNLNHRDDCAGTLHHLMFLEHPAPIYLGCDGHPEDRAVIIRWIAKRLGVDVPAPTSATPSSRRGNKRCTNQRLRESGYRFQYPDYKAGYGPLIDEMTR